MNLLHRLKQHKRPVLSKSEGDLPSIPPSLVIDTEMRASQTFSDFGALPSYVPELSPVNITERWLQAIQDISLLKEIEKLFMVTITKKDYQENENSLAVLNGLLAHGFFDRLDEGTKAALMKSFFDADAVRCLTMLLKNWPHLVDCKHGEKARTLLHCAVIGAKTEMVPVLCAHGADRMAKDGDGKTMWDLLDAMDKAKKTEIKS